MAATINTNIASINAQRNLSLSGQSLTTTMQRLSSGLRVNSAKDDAAGLAIAERMNTQVKGLTVASRNANDGISLAQTAEGALGKVGDMLQRMRELAVQASNATNSASDRVALQAEVKQLAAEIDRVAKQTNFNGQKILDGSFAGAVFQVGANSGDNVTLGALADTRSSQISTINYGISKLTGVNTDDTTDPTKPAIADHRIAIPAGTLVLDVGNGSFNVPLEAINPANSSLERLGQVVTAINNKTADTGVTAYMTKNPGTQTYDIEFVSERVDGEGKPLTVNFQGFTSSTTGIGYATAEYVEPSQQDIAESVTTARAAGGPLATASPDVNAAKTAANSIAAQMKTSSIATSDEKLEAAIASYEQTIADAATNSVGSVNTAVDKLVAAYNVAHRTTPQPLTPSAATIDEALAAATAAATPAGPLNGNSTASGEIAAAKTAANAIRDQISASGLAGLLTDELDDYTAATTTANSDSVDDIKAAIDALALAYSNAHSAATNPATTPAPTTIEGTITAAGDLSGTSGDPVAIAAAKTAADAIRDQISASGLAGLLTDELDDYTAATTTANPDAVDDVKAAIDTLALAYSNAHSAATNPATTPAPDVIEAAIDADSVDEVVAGALTGTAVELPPARTAANGIAAEIKASAIATRLPENTALTEAITTYDQAIANETDTDTVGKVKDALQALTTAYKTELEKMPVPSPMDMDDEAEFMTNQRGIETIDVTTQTGAWIALKKIDSAIDQINGARATLGAMQARFENAVNNIDIQVENLSAARGRIMDADFAVETANLSRTQILQQAGTAMVAQANQIPQSVLKLLQG